MASYSDASRSWSRDGAGGEKTATLRLTVDAERGVAETAMGETVAVEVVPSRVARARLDADPRVPGRSVVELFARGDSDDGDNNHSGPSQRLGFDLVEVGGRPVMTSKIQARRFLKWLRSANPAIPFPSK